MNYTVPIIALTANVLKKDREECLDAGCNEHLSKPVDRAKLFATLSRYLPSGDDAKGESHETADAQANDPNKLIHEPATCDRLPDDLSGEHSDEDLIDWQDLQQRVMNEGLIERMATVFLTEYPKQVELLAQSVRTASAEEIRSQAHTLKGAAASMGAKPLSQAAYRLECAGRESREKIFAALFQKLETEFDRLADYISNEDWMETARNSNNGPGRMRPGDE